MLLVDCVLGGGFILPWFCKVFILGFHVLVMRWTYWRVFDWKIVDSIKITDSFRYQTCWGIACVSKFLSLPRYLDDPWRWFFCWFQSYTSCYVWKGDDRSFPWDVMVPRKWDHPDTPEMSTGETSEKFGFQSHKPQIIYGDGVMVERISSEYIFWG